MRKIIVSSDYYDKLVQISNIARNLNILPGDKPGIRNFIMLSISDLDKIEEFVEDTK